MAARAKAAFEAEAEVRRIANLAQNKGSAESADLRSREPNSSKDGKSAAKAAEQLGVSTRAVEQASRLIKQGDDSLVEAVNHGTVSLDAAEKVAGFASRRQVVVCQHEAVGQSSVRGGDPAFLAGE